MKQSRFFRWFAIFTLAIASAAGAASPTEAPTTKVNPSDVEFWSEFAGADTKPVMDRIVEAFNAEHPEFHVVHVAFATNNDYEAAVKTAFASGEIPDVVELNAGGWLSPYIEADQLTDLTDLVDQYAGSFDSGTIDVVTYKGRHWGVPFGKVPGNLIYYNRDVLAENGIDPATLTTWDTFMAACEQLKRAGVTPIIFGNKEGWPGAHWLGHLFYESMGVEKATELFRRGLQPGFTTDLKFTDPEAVRPWELLKQLQDDGYFSAGIVSDDFPTASAKFFNGEGAFLQTGGWLLGIQRDQAPDFPLGYMRFPSLDDVTASDANPYVFNAVSLTVPEAAENADGARAFIEWWLSSETPHRMWSEGRPGDLPAVTTIESLEGVPPEVNEFLQLQNEAKVSSMFLDSLIEGDLSTEVLWEASNGLFIGALTPQQAAETAETLVSQWQADHPE